MAQKNTEEIMDKTGLNTFSDRREGEYDLVTALLKAADFKSSDDSISDVKISRNGQYLFTVHLHPISDADSRLARKKATTMMPNPNGKKYPPIEKEFNSALFHSWLIYIATTDEDKQKIWGNKAIMDKYDLTQPVESVDVLLQVGEKVRLVDIVTDISGMDPDDDDDETSPEEFAKN